MRLLIAAGAALGAAAVGILVYPHLVAAGINSAVLAGLSAVVVVCVVAVFGLPIVAIVRRLVR
ncbi:hypothetical protein ACWKSP_35570 [Micromonosporaceae bacterium Da 78-11]